MSYSIVHNDVKYVTRKTYLAPVYHDLECKLGGRSYGAAYQRMPSEWRPYLLIDGNPTVEKDFSACFGRLAYHLNGKDAPEDPYAVEIALYLLQKRGVSYDNARDIIKLAFQCMFNCSSVHDASCALWKKEWVREIIPLTYELSNAIVRLIEESHPDIEEWFFQGRGLELIES